MDINLSLRCEYLSTCHLGIEGKLGLDLRESKLKLERNTRNWEIVV